MIINISNRQRASLVGVLILVAYSMLTYTITKNVAMGVVMDIISGFSVIGVPILMFPIFNTYESKSINYAYMACRFIEGILMMIGGALILIPALNGYRDIIYQSVHIYFFIIGAFLFYILLYRIQIIPRFISIWGIVATLLLLIITLIKLFGVNLIVLNALLIPMILNEIVLAVWLITKGFKQKIHRKNIV